MNKTPQITKKVGRFYLTDHLLGEGMHGKVYLARSANENVFEIFACKVIEKRKLTKQAAESLRQEVEISRKIKSANVVRLYECEETVHRYYLFMQYCNGGDLDGLLALRPRLTEAEAKFVLKAITNGLKKLSANGIIHRDLKPANIMIKFKNFTY